MSEDLELRLAIMTTYKNNVYTERNRLVALLASLFPSTQCKTSIKDWSSEWHNCVYITLPNGQQLSWHYHDKDKRLFMHVPIRETIWDGHTTEQKYERIEQFIATRNAVQIAQHEANLFGSGYIQVLPNGEMRVLSTFDVTLTEKKYR